ncbi:MAG: hypothetical protein RL033_3356 [Pseudomonadota bacterium]|jgi:hypothetical protein
MPPNASDVYVGSVIALFLKYTAATVLQARERFAQRRFRYPEDAACWRGEVGDDTELCQRAQGLLRNDAESQPFYLVLGAAYVGLGLWPLGGVLYFGVYPLTRWYHAFCLLRGLQPHRNRAFALGLALVVLLAAHVGYAVVRPVAASAPATEPFPATTVFQK